MSTTPKAVEVPSAPTKKTIPGIREYRFPVWDIDMSTCSGRAFKEDSKDTRWKPHIFRESQCGRQLVAGSDLCLFCTTRKEKADEADTDVAKAKLQWNGLITEEPPTWTHMLGTAWAEKSNPVFTAEEDPTAAEIDELCVSLGAAHAEIADLRDMLAAKDAENAELLAKLAYIKLAFL